jgi:hypothetical protein
MNFNFDLRDIMDFNGEGLSDDEKKNILNIFNLNKYKYVLNILKDINVDKESYEILQLEKEKVIEQANINFIINSSNFTSSIMVGIKYYLYKNEDKTYSCSQKKTESDILKSEYLGCFELQEDLTWSKY